MSSIHIDIHDPELDSINVHDTGAVAVRLGEYPVQATLYFKNLDMAEDHVMNLRHELHLRRRELDHAQLGRLFGEGVER